MPLPTCVTCGSDDLDVDPDPPDGPGIAVKCLACGFRWRRQPKPICRRCGSGEVDEGVIDGWAFDDLEQAREDPQTDQWSYVDKVIYTCQRCRYQWQSVDAVRPYQPSPRDLALKRQELLAGFSERRLLSDSVGLAEIPDEEGVHLVWVPNGRLLYVGQSTRTRSRIREHLTGDREASILHEKVGRRLDGELGRSALRDEIRAWLEQCEVSFRLTDNPSTLKARIMDYLEPELNEVRPHDA